MFRVAMSVNGTEFLFHIICIFVPDYCAVSLYQFARRMLTKGDFLCKHSVTADPIDFTRVI
jgi:hypothetical protein